MIPTTTTRSPYVQFAPIHGGAFALNPSRQHQQQQPHPFAPAQSLPFPPDTNPSTSDPKTAFRAPAHKHAHHLHSIPPREKSTRTLIIDHMLWVHARTRFAQARAELGMTDRTGGPTSLNYAHRERPENYEEEEDVLSDGEDLAALYSTEPRPDELRKQDLGLARSLRLRAEGLEKVVTSMLDQPPAIHPMTDHDPATPPTSPKSHPSHPHALPNGVRLRLALSTVLNDLFARQAARPPIRQQIQCSQSTSTSSIPNTACSALPDALLPLFTISAASVRPAPADPPSSTGYPSSCTVRPQPPSAPSPRTLSLYLAGAHPSTALSPPALRCPRHLYTGCEICVEAKSGGGSARAASRYGLESTAGQYGTRTGGGISGWQDGSGIGSGLARPAVGGSVLRRTPPTLSGVVRGGGEAARNTGNTKLSELVLRFVRLSALVATELGREAREDEVSEAAWGSDQASGQEQGQQSSPPPSSGASASTQTQNRMYGYTLQPSREWYMLLVGLLTRAVLEGYLTAGWRGPEAVECLLTVGLGVTDSGDKASDSGTRSEDDGGEDLCDEFEEFEPDELPSLKDAVRMLFPALRTGAPPRADSAEAEYANEMGARLRKFYDIPPSTPGLAAHMEHLAWQYHAEPVERAAARFCESIAKWRGKPELETYKKRPLKQPADAETPGNATMTIDALVHSSPITPSANIADEAGARKPSIERYFLLPSVMRENGWVRRKRGRSSDEGARGGKRVVGYVKQHGNA